MKGRFYRYGSSLVMLGWLIAGANGPAHAQTATATPAPEQASANTGVADIVVTAQKRQQKLSDVGISISALGADTIKQLSLTDTTSIISQIANIDNSSIYGPGTNPNFSIRGVSQNDFNDGTESPVASYVDEVYLVPTGASSFPLYDMERVEVLRGPQGTLFGRNSTAGLIQFITAKPTDAFGGSIQGRFGSYGTREVTGVFNTPVTDTLDFRLAGQYHDNHGWLKNLTGNQPKGGQIITGSVRGQLRYRPASNVDDVLKVSYDHAKGATYDNLHEVTAQDPVSGDQYLVGPNQNPYGTGNQRDEFGYGNVTHASDNGSINRLRDAESTLISNKLDVTLGRVVITSVTGYDRYERDQVEDCDGTQGRTCQTHYNSISHQFSEELRAYANLGSLRLTGGVYYLYDKIKLDDIAPLYLDTPSALAIVVDAKQVSKSYAVFANAEYDLAPKLTFIAGLRGSRDEKHFQETLTYALPCDRNDPFAGYDHILGSQVATCGAIATNVFTDATAPDYTRLKKDTWSAKAELNYKLNPATLLYASVSRGVKSPGYNNGVISISLAPQNYQFKSETLYAYEGGVKTAFDGRRVTLDLSGFYYDYRNFDTLSFSGIESLITNADAKLYGAEAELTARVTDRLTFRANGGYTHTKLEDVANAGGIVANRQMPLAPKWNTSALIRYEMPVMLKDEYKLGLQLSGRARASFYSNPGNDSAGKNPSYGILDARIDFAPANDRFSVAVVAKNLLNKRYFSTLFLGTGIGGYRFGQYGPPRWVTVELNYKF